MTATPAVNTSGSVTADGTEQTLATITDARVLMLMVDCAALVDGDIIELRIYGKARSGDTERLLLPVATIPHTQSVPLVWTPPVMSPHHFRATLKQVSGTNRAFPWAIYEAA